VAFPKGYVTPGALTLAERRKRFLFVVNAMAANGGRITNRDLAKLLGITFAAVHQQRAIWLRKGYLRQVAGRQTSTYVVTPRGRMFALGCDGTIDPVARCTSCGMSFVGNALVRHVNETGHQVEAA
jgi:hypothetical protein